MATQHSSPGDAFDAVVTTSSETLGGEEVQRILLTPKPGSRVGIRHEPGGEIEWFDPPASTTKSPRHPA